jgi:hypothetical protein
MNIEKLIMTVMLCFVSWSSVYIAVSQPKEKVFGNKHLVTELRRTDDFDLETVIDNKPFTGYYLGDKRNPFVPVEFTKPEDGSGAPTEVTSIDPKFKWKFPKPDVKPEPPKPDPEPVVTPPVIDNDVPVVNIPGKPGPEEKPEEPVIKKAEELGIPVALIGFVKTEGAGPRKAILANRKSGEVFTVTEGEYISRLDMRIVTVTPFSIILKMKNGERVEFVNDILKEAHQSNAKSP